MEHEFLKSLVIIFGTSVMVVFLLNRLRIPSIVGFLAAGVIIGPYGVGMVEDIRSVEMMAEVGVILLLFTIGIEFSLARLVRMKKAVLGAGGSQVLLTLCLSAFFAYLLTGHVNRSIFIGFLVALSSTAIVLKMLSEQGETDSPHGRMMVGILVFQDLCVVPLMLLIPSLSGGGVQVADIAMRMGKAAFIIAIVLLGARWAVPVILHQVVHTRSRELFITTIILLCLGIALLTSRFGLSLALGAFLAGLIISESEYAHQAAADILPFKDSFIGLFFVSVGMLMDTGYILDNFLRIAVAVLLIFGLKVLTGILSVLMIGSPLRSSIHAGLGLAQIGEFSFVLAIAGKVSGLITEDFYQIFLASSVITMMATPFILKAAPDLSAWITARHLLEKAARIKRGSEREGLPRTRQGHVIVVGFGLNGRNLARVLREIEIPYVVLEINSDTVRSMKDRGEPIYYGDGTSTEILRKLGIERAKLLVIAISDPVSTRKITSIARHENAGLYIIVRTRYLAEVDDLKALGADEVIPEEFETSIEIFARVLNHYRFPNNVVLDMVERIRSDNYTAFRSVEVEERHLFEKCEWLPEIGLDGYRVPVGSYLIDKSISELQVRKITLVTIIAVRRASEVFSNPDPDFRFKEGDIILFTGDRNSMNKALTHFKGGA